MMKNRDYLIPLVSIITIALSSCFHLPNRSSQTSSSNETNTSSDTTSEISQSSSSETISTSNISSTEVITSVPSSNTSSSQSSFISVTSETSSITSQSISSSHISSTSSSESPSSITSQISITSSSSITSITSSESIVSSLIASTSQIISSSQSSSTSEQIIDDYQVIETFSKRMPAEFEPVEMVKMCYPNNMPLSVYKEIAKDNKILLLVNPDRYDSSRISEAQTALNNAGVNMDNVTFLDMNIDDDYTYWVRDFSPFYVFNNLDLGIVDFTYNRDRYEQNAVPKKLSTYFDMSYSKMDLVHTGGNLMQDGRGTSFSDDLVVSENSNDKNKVTSQMKQYTGTDNYVITIDPQGDYIAHIDCWGKIVAPDTIIVAKLPSSNSRYKYYEQVANELANTKCAYGYNYRIYRVEEPGGDTIAPYTNSLIANKHVYVPMGENSYYNQKALEVYQQALPDYSIVGVEGYSFNQSNCFLNTDALHCRSHEVPDKNMLFIDSREVLHGEIEPQAKYLVKTNIVSYANSSVDENDVKIYYSIDDAPYESAHLSRYKDTTNFIYYFDGLKSGDNVKYYIEAKDASNNKNVDPTNGDKDPHSFSIK